MFEVLNALRSLIDSHRLALGIAHVDIYRDNLDIEQRLRSEQLPLIAIIDAGTRRELSDLAGEIRDIFSVRLRYIHQTISREKTRSDNKVGAYPVISRLKQLLGSVKKLTEFCPDAENEVVDGTLGISWTVTPGLYALSESLFAEVHDLNITYYKDSEWISNENDDFHPIIDDINPEVVIK